MRYNETTFINKANIKHNHKYDYSLVEYINSQTKVKIVCPEHGIFEQIPSMHLLRNGCPLCGNKQKSMKKIKTREWFIDKANIKHHHKYDYSLVEYINSQTKVKIICPEHGEFLQTPNSHINHKSGCPSCGGVKKKTTGEFINMSQKIHGNRYDYSKVNYINGQKDVIIICPIHGKFLQRPNSHTSNQMQGCPKCQSSKKEIIIRKILHNNGYKYELLLS